MESERPFRKIKAYCFEHQATCDVIAKPRIVCTIEEHTLSVDFPNAEFWQFCCDCETFFPTKSEVTGKVISNCPSCDRTALRHFICQTCNIASFESDEPARGKSYKISSNQGIEPRCPGCETLTQRGRIIRHECRNLEAEFFTARGTCPFCLESTESGFVIPHKQASDSTNSQCPECHFANPASALVCEKCGSTFGKHFAGGGHGPNVNKPQTPESGLVCPVCSTPIPPSSDFCGECGQVLGSLTPPPPPPPQKKAPNSFGDTFESTGISPGMISSEEKMLSSSPLKIVAALGVLAVLIVVITAALNSSALNGTSAANANQNSKQSKGSSPVISVTPNTSNSDNRIGKTGTLTRDVNLRELPGADYMKVGTQYRGARVTILDVTPVSDSAGNRFDWFKIQVTGYGISMESNNNGQSKDPGSSDVGWIHSYPNVSQTKIVVRANSISFGN